MFTDFEFLQKVPLFVNISAHDLPTLMSCLSATIKSYEKDEIIFMAGDPATCVGIILSGKAHVQSEDFMGNRTIIAALDEGDLFGESMACAHVEKLPVSVVATESCRVMLIDYRKIVSICPSSCSFHSRLIENMLTIVASKNVILNQKVEIISRRSTREKLITYLSAQAQKAGGSSFTIPFSRQDLADFLCVERSAMSAEISKLQRDGMIKTSKNKFELLYGRD
ncbi:MAG: Crp/Fnr family transcriptional regulator [Christensenellales bacterium]|jgi:CRP-like cAMP-binding protein